MIPTVIYISLIVLLTLYFVFNISVVLGWFKLVQTSKVENKESISFSILIPMRNEEKNILNIIKDINNQNYNKEDYEIIIIDDHSSDQSFKLVNNLKIENLTLIKVVGEGKKSAIETGLTKAKNKYIVQTDADCSVDKNWLSSIDKYLNTHSVKLLIAPVIFKAESSFFSRLQELDFFALIMSTAGLTKLKHPVMANGANLIYPKEILKNIDVLNPQTSSGDDIFLLHYIKKEYGTNTIHFLKSTDATVRTAVSSNLKIFLNQRIRWASKSKYYRDFDTIAIGSLVFLINIALLVSFFAAFFIDMYKELFLVFFVSKFFLDYLLLFPILSFYKRTSLIIYSPILSFIYPFYISFVAIVSPFKSFVWKDRKYK